ncbi:MAG: LysR family transcriptional regulator [Pseudomonadota bacterium]
MATPRNLDLASLRSVVAIVDAGTMTRAAARLHLTQSAISMQVKRLEATLGSAVFDRSPQGLTPTPAGEQLVHYARKLLALNDEAWGRLTAPDYEGEVALGCPSDIVDNWVPAALQAFSRDFPRVQVQLSTGSTGSTVHLLSAYHRGELDVILTTELDPRPDATVLDTQQLVWTGSHGGSAWQRRPLPFASCGNCAFRNVAVAALDDADVDWVSIVNTNDDRAIDAMAKADLCVRAELAGQVPAEREAIDHRGTLPDLPSCAIALYRGRVSDNTLADKLAAYLVEHKPHAV